MVITSLKFVIIVSLKSNLYDRIKAKSSDNRGDPKCVYFTLSFLNIQSKTYQRNEKKK